MCIRDRPNYSLSGLKYLLSFVILIGLYRLVWMIYGIRYVVRPVSYTHLDVYKRQPQYGQRQHHRGS